MKQETSIEEIAQKIVALSRCGPMQPDGVAANKSKGKALNNESPLS